MRRLLLGIVLLFVLFTGGYQLFLKPADIVLPPVEPLAASVADLQKLYGLASGSHEVVTVETITVNANDEVLGISAYHPRESGQYPLILFSHGNFSSRDQYDALIHHWVSHGYTVIAPDHLDSGGTVSGIWAMTVHGKDGVLVDRPIKLSFILDHLGELESLAPEFHNRVDASKIAAAGHSFGGFSAQMLGGATAVHPKTGALIEHADPRIMAVVAISPPGPMFDMITESSWETLKRPQIVTTGTWDMEARFWPRWQLHAMSYERAPVGENYLLVTQGADHYFGNLICRLDREGDPQRNELDIALSATTAFLDAFVKESAAAQAFLDGSTISNTTQGFSVLERR